MSALDFVDIHDIIAKLERDPLMSAHLVSARIRLAPLLYPDGGPEYERMMRGEPPPGDASSRSEPHA
jgi:hypothetical protein